MQISGLRFPKAGAKRLRALHAKRLPQRRYGNVPSAGQFHRKLQLRTDFLVPDSASVVSGQSRKGFRPQRTYPRACAPFGTRAFAARRRPSVRRSARSLPCRFGGATRCRVSASVRRPGAPRQPRSALASAICAAPGEYTHPGCGTELAILPDSDSNFGWIDSRQRRWDSSPRDVAKAPKDLEGDPSPGRTGSGCAFNRAARFQTPTGSKATKSSKRHGGKGCSDATRLWRRNILRGVRTCIAGKAIAPETR